MTRLVSGVVRSSILALTAAGAAGCTDTAGVDGMGRVQVTMQRITPGATTQTVAGLYASLVGASSIPIEAGGVSSLTVEVTSIQFLPVIEDDATGDDAEWVPLDFADPVVLDLMALPTVDGSPIVIAGGVVPEGSYRKVRLLVSGGTITFDDSFTVGTAVFDADHPVTIPSGAETGIKTDVVFTVTTDGNGDPQDVNLLFDEGATFQNATATGDGTVILSPVLKN